MSAPQSPDRMDLPPTLARVDRECDRFEAAWKAGQRPALEDHIAAVPGPDRPAMLRELIPLEIDYRRLAGEHPQAEEFLARFPTLDHAWIVGLLPGEAPSATGGLTTVLAAPPAGEPADALLGRRIGPYLIQQRLGSGGMGNVYRALREDAYRQQVALKVIRPGLDGDEILRRFRTERQVLAELQHPHIARLLDGGATDDGRPYFVMEYIDGEPLDRYCDRRQLSTRERVELFRSVCAAVQHAHAQGVIHRDLKPGNVLVSADGTVKVTDFGLAKRLEGGPAGSAQTASGAVLGTPSYMAPEQAAGKAKEVGPATDVHALGAVLYELLTGRPPFQAEAPLDTLLQVMNDEPVPPGRLHPRLARDLETICLKCLQKEPARRYPSVAALTEDLRRFLAGESIQARPVGRVEQLGRWCRRHPARAVAAACALLAVVIAGLFARQAYLTDQQRRGYEEQLRGEKRQYAEERALLAAMSGDAEGAAKAIGEAEFLGASPGQMHLLRGQVALHRGDVEAARDQVKQAVRLMPESVAARAMLALAYYHSGQGSRFDQIALELDQMTPHTAEDFLFKGQAECLNRPELALQTLDEAIKRRNSILSRSVRLEVRTSYAQFTDDAQVAQLALEDAQAAKAMLPGHAVTLSRSVHAHLVAAAVFDKRGQAERSRAALDQAGRDARALEPFTSVPPALMARFHYYDYVDDQEAALAVSQLGTEYRHALMLYRGGDYPKALAAADRAVARGYGLARIERGFILPELSNGPQRALEAFRDAAAKAEVGLQSLYAPMMLLLLEQRAQAVQASLKVRSNPALVPPWYQGWYHRLLDYLCGRITGDELFKAAGCCRPKLCEAHFAIGLHHLSQRDREGARVHFQKCAETRVFIYWDYMWGRAFLKRLEEDRTWPPWIPPRN